MYWPHPLYVAFHAAFEIAAWLAMVPGAVDSAAPASGFGV